jgi:hypothetical protein
MPGDFVNIWIGYIFQKNTYGFDGRGHATTCRAEVIFIKRHRELSRQAVTGSGTDSGSASRVIPTFQASGDFKVIFLGIVPF